MVVVAVALRLFSAAALAAAMVSAARRFLSSASSSCVHMISRIGNTLSRSWRGGRAGAVQGYVWGEA